MTPECGEHSLFKSPDGTWRCKGCHLYPDTCNCRPETKLRLLRVLGIIE